MPLPVHNHESFIGGTPAYQAVNGPIRGLYRPIASLHANPAHSALRRARHFDRAGRLFKTIPNGGHIIAYREAARAQMWSVR